MQLVCFYVVLPLDSMVRYLRYLSAHKHVLPCNILYVPVPYQSAGPNGSDLDIIYRYTFKLDMLKSKTWSAKLESQITTIKQETSTVVRYLIGHYSISVPNPVLIITFLHLPHFLSITIVLQYKSCYTCFKWCASIKKLQLLAVKNSKYFLNVL